MGNLQFVDRSNVGGFFRSKIPFQNAVGIENWPQHVQDEHGRVRENDQERKFIPLEEFPGTMIVKATEQKRDAPIVDIFGGVLGDDRLDTVDKIYAYYKMLYPQYFHGPALGAL